MTFKLVWVRFQSFTALQKPSWRRYFIPKDRDFSRADNSLSYGFSKVIFFMGNLNRWGFRTNKKQDSKNYPLQSMILDLSRNFSCVSVADVHPRWQTAFCGLRLPLGSFELRVGKTTTFCLHIAIHWFCNNRRSNTTP